MDSHSNMFSDNYDDDFGGKSEQKSVQGKKDEAKNDDFFADDYSNNFDGNQFSSQDGGLGKDETKNY